MQNEMHRFSPLEVVRGFLKASPARAFGLVGALALAGALAGIGIAFAATTTRAPSATESVDPEDALPESAPSPSPSGSPTAGPEETASDQTPEGQPPPEGQAPSGGLTESPPAATAPPAPVPDTTPPVISVGSLPAVIAVDVGCPASGFVVTATDASGVASVEVNDDHPDVWVSQYWRDGDRFGFSGNGQWPTWPYYSVGHAQVVTAVIVATDSVGNQSSVTRTFNYYDNSSYCDET